MSSFHPICLAGMENQFVYWAASLGSLASFIILVVLFVKMMKKNNKK